MPKIDEYINNRRGFKFKDTEIYVDLSTGSLCFGFEVIPKDEVLDLIKFLQEWYE